MALSLTPITHTSLLISITLSCDPSPRFCPPISLNKSADLSAGLPLVLDHTHTSPRIVMRTRNVVSALKKTLGDSLSVASGCDRETPSV